LNIRSKNKLSMADANGALAQETANLHLDEVTGEKVSKSELKKRQKVREQEKKKAEKAAAAPPKTEKKKVASAEANEAELNPNVRIFAVSSFASLTGLAIL
jgi:lysyl-tRNA synthetase class 2